MFRFPIPHFRNNERSTRVPTASISQRSIGAEHALSVDNPTTPSISRNATGGLDDFQMGLLQDFWRGARLSSPPTGDDGVRSKIAGAGVRWQTYRLRWHGHVHWLCQFNYGEVIACMFVYQRELWVLYDFLYWIGFCISFVVWPKMDLLNHMGTVTSSEDMYPGYEGASTPSKPDLPGKLMFACPQPKNHTDAITLTFLTTLTLSRTWRHCCLTAIISGIKSMISFITVVDATNKVALTIRVMVTVSFALIALVSRRTTRIMNQESWSQSPDYNDYNYIKLIEKC